MGNESDEFVMGRKDIELWGCNTFDFGNGLGFDCGIGMGDDRGLFVDGGFSDSEGGGCVGTGGEEVTGLTRAAIRVWVCSK